MLDSRIKTLAHNLVNYSCAVKKGERVLIEATDVDYMLINGLVKEIYDLGAYPFVNLSDSRVSRELLRGTSVEHASMRAEYDKPRMEAMQAYIGVRGGNNSFENSDVNPDNMAIHAKHYAHPIHHEIRVGKTKWVVLRYPSPSMAQSAGMSTDAFEEFYFNVCNLDYSKMDKAMTPLKDLMERTDKVRIKALDTDISFSIKGIKAKKCSGHMNIPDGEVYTAPVRNSVNGVISYNTPSINQGLSFEKVRFEFKDGKIVKGSANFNEQLQKILETDEGARYIGEFALGVNPYIVKPTGDILFDEKISGSIHFTPGSCYEDAYNGNQSAVHWDLVQIQTKEYGGGEIYFDNVLIRKDGRFTLKELEPLNPENLK